MRSRSTKKIEWGFTVSEAARSLGVSRQYLYQLIKDRKLFLRIVPAVEYRFSLAEIDEMASGGRRGPGVSCEPLQTLPSAAASIAYNPPTPRPRPWRREAVPRGNPTRTAPSLVRALRGAHGSPLFATWTTLFSSLAELFRRNHAAFDRH
jgi:excisionase family DNA binding protein